MKNEMNHFPIENMKAKNQFLSKELKTILHSR